MGNTSWTGPKHVNVHAISSREPTTRLLAVLAVSRELYQQGGKGNLYSASLKQPWLRTSSRESAWQALRLVWLVRLALTFSSGYGTNQSYAASIRPALMQHDRRMYEVALIEEPDYPSCSQLAPPQSAAARQSPTRSALVPKPSKRLSISHGLQSQESHKADGYVTRRNGLSIKELSSPLRCAAMASIDSSIASMTSIYQTVGLASNPRHYYNVFALPSIPQAERQMQLIIRPFTASTYDAIKERESVNDIRRQAKIRCPQRHAAMMRSSTTNLPNSVSTTYSVRSPCVDGGSPLTDEELENRCERDSAIHEPRDHGRPTTGPQPAPLARAAHADETYNQRDSAIVTGNCVSSSLHLARNTTDLAVAITHEAFPPQQSSCSAGSLPRLTSAKDLALSQNASSNELEQVSTSDLPRKWTTADYETIVHLRDRAQLDWKSVLSYFPGATLQSVKVHYREQHELEPDQQHGSAHGVTQAVTYHARRHGSTVHKTPPKGRATRRRHQKTSVDLPMHRPIDDRSATAIEPSRRSRSGRTIRHPFRHRPQEGYL